MIVELLVAHALAADPGAPITLERAMEIAEQNAVDAESARLAIESARVDLHRAKHAFAPDLGLSVSTSATIGRTFSEGLGQSVTTPGANSTARVTSTVPLLGGGERHADVRSAEANLAAGLATAKRTRQDLEYTLAGGLLDLAEARGNVGLAEITLAAEEALRERIRAYVDAGARTRADLLLEDAAVAAAARDLSTARANVGLAELTLVDVLRLDPASTWTFVPPEAAPASASEGAATRSDIVAADKAAEAASADVQAARAGAWPSADLSFGASTSWYSTDTSALPSQLQDQARAWATVDVEVPIFDRAVTRDSVSDSRIAERAAKLDAARAQETAAADLARARLDDAAARDALDAASHQRDAQAAAVAVLQDRYDAGAAALTELLSARADLASAEQARLAAAIQVTRAGFELAWAAPATP